jgi:hypothetical protein
MWPLKQSDGPEPEITPEHGFALVLTMLAFWMWLNFFCPCVPAGEAMTWADMFDGATLVAVEIAGTVLLFLGVLCFVGLIVLAVYFAGKILQALLRLMFATRRWSRTDAPLLSLPTPDLVLADRTALAERLGTFTLLGEVRRA